MSENISVLIIEDAIWDYELIVRELKKNFARVTTFRVEEKITYLNLLQTTEIHLIISDFNVPGFGALPALQLLKEEGLEIPFIIVSGALGDEKAAETIRAGAFDLIMKSNLARLAPTVKMALRSYQGKKLEQERVKHASESASLREQAMAVVSHDIKSPLSAIQLSLGIVQKKLDDPATADRDESIRKYLQRMDRALLRIKSMVVDYIDQLNIDSGGFRVEKALSRVDLLCRELEDVFVPIAEKKKIHFAMTCVQEEVFGVFDYARIFQALMNLIGNAIKFTPENGKITATFEVRDNNLIFWVQDSGPGIADDCQEHIFEKFWSAKDSNESTSAGLGLFITKAIAEAHGGAVMVESEEGRGAKFTLRIPQGDLANSRNMPAIIENEDSHRDKQIVLVEDDDDLHDLLKELLEKEGFKVVSFQSGHQAFEALSRDSIKPHLIMVDYQLPGMNGEEIAKAVRKIDSMQKVPVLISSAQKNLDHLRSEKDNVFVLKKPIVFSELTRMLKEILQ